MSAAERLRLIVRITSQAADNVLIRLSQAEIDEGQQGQLPENPAEIDELLQEIDAVLEAPDSVDDTVRAAPSHYPEIPASTMSELWNKAKKQD